MPQLADFKKTVADYLSYEVNQILSGSLKKDTVIASEQSERDNPLTTENLLGKY